MDPLMPASTPHVSSQLGFLFADISRLARKEFDRRVKHLGLTRAQWLFLYYLARQPGATQSDLAEVLQMEKITISRQAERLEKAGWIERNEHGHDGRAYHLQLAPRAMRMVDRLEGFATQLREEYLHGLAPGRRAALLDDLSLIKQNLLQLETAPRRKISA
jgi:DNA-binding MarR family transcriptional regulator